MTDDEAEERLIARPRPARAIDADGAGAGPADARADGARVDVPARLRRDAAAHPLRAAREAVEVAVAHDGVDLARARDELGGDDLGAGAVLGLRREQEARIARVARVRGAVVVVDPRGEARAEPVDERERRLLEAVPAGLRREGDVEHGDAPGDLARLRQLAGRREGEGEIGCGHRRACARKARYHPALVKPHALARGAVFLIAAATAAVVRVGGPGAPVSVAEARADSLTTTGCALRGSAPVTRGAELFDAQTGGRVIAKFTGGVVPLTVSSFPADPTQGRARASTSAGGTQLRVDGYAAASSFQVYTARDLPIAPGHVWIASAQKIRLVGATPTTLTGELVVVGSASQAVRASGGCDAFTLQRGTPRPIDVPGNGRLYSSKGAELELFDQPDGAAVLKLRMTASQLFWSNEARGGYVHVLARTDLVVDAWAKASSLEAQKAGEMVDQAAPTQTVVSSAQLSVNGSTPTLVVATKDTAVRARRDDKETPIGALETGAEAYIMETMMGWVNLLPKHLGFQPGDGGGYWVPASELPRR